MKRILFVVCCLWFVVGMKAQTAAKTLKIAVFAPVYLDSAFTNDTYKLGRNNLPGYILPGLDFYNGVMFAIDSLNIEKAPIEVLFFDSKSASSSIQQIVAGTELQDVSLIIASFTNRNEIKYLADF